MSGLGHRRFGAVFPALRCRWVGLRWCAHCPVNPLLRWRSRWWATKNPASSSCCTRVARWCSIDLVRHQRADQVLQALWGAFRALRRYP
ncbi:hypothetical protein I546_6588 [Mycobacterium kansasii 732]|nr:hypothetical protein I546_6588 [Mycobacterium kansasii 732]